MANVDRILCRVLPVATVDYFKNRRRMKIWNTGTFYIYICGITLIKVYYVIEPCYIEFSGTVICRSQFPVFYSTKWCGSVGFAARFCSHWCFVFSSNQGRQWLLMKENTFKSKQIKIIANSWCVKWFTSTDFFFVLWDIKKRLFILE